MYSATKVMTRNKNILMLIVFVCALFLLPFFVGAQDDTKGIEESAPIASNTADESCFDYYTFGSVEVDVQSDLSQTTSGGAIHF